MLCQVLAGTGGVGKTQLAVHRARHVWARGEVDLLVWVTASTRTAIIAGYAQAAAEVLGADPTDSEQAARSFLAWLEPKSGTTQRRWLIVLDDLADPADLRGLWPPQSPHGRTLVTTRRRDAALTGYGRRLVQVGLFTPDEALTYLATALASHGRTEPPAELAALADELGHLPLALSQAVAYVIDADLDCAAYRGLLADRVQALADLLPDPSGLPDDQPATVAALWSLSVSRADQLPPVGLAHPMLRLTAVLAASGIPDPVLASPAALTYLTEHRTGLDRQSSTGQATAQDAKRALRILHRLSLIDHIHREVRVHQLVQRVTRDSLTAEQRGRLACTVADALTDSWPDMERDTALAQALRSNTDALISHAEDALYQSDGAHQVLLRAGRSLGEAGQHAAAVDYFRRLTNTAREKLGPDHPDTLAARHHLAHWTGEAGDPVGAVAALETLLDHMLQVFDADDLEVFKARATLATWRGEAGNAVGAVSDLQELLADSDRVLGSDHPKTLIIIRNNLARWRGEAGDATGAISAFEELLAKSDRILGSDHPETLTIRHNLAEWRGRAGNADAAKSDYLQLIDQLKQVLGPDHLLTLTSVRRFANWQGESGDAAGAVAFLESALNRVEHVLGPDHPIALSFHVDLLSWQGNAGEASRVVAAFDDLLDRISLVLGPDHLYALIARRNYAFAQWKSGDTVGALASYQKLLPDEERVLGPDHPETLATRHNLASMRGEAGDALGAASAYDQLLPRMLRVLGGDHPLTLAAQASSARWRHITDAQIGLIPGT
ncbi:tetratricopeptide repeat protein [Streptomyces sp. SLBN-115]|nr:tetratricopeptide repeat protein [Streptomyces sp. SLBN-115]